MATQFLAGDRVVISSDYHWAKNATGTVGAPPSQVVALSGPWQNNLTRTVKTSWAMHSITGYGSTKNKLMPRAMGRMRAAKFQKKS